MKEQDGNSEVIEATATSEANSEPECVRCDGAQLCHLRARALIGAMFVFGSCTLEPQPVGVPSDRIALEEPTADVTPTMGANDALAPADLPSVADQCRANPLLVDCPGSDRAADVENESSMVLVDAGVPVDAAPTSSMGADAGVAPDAGIADAD